MLLPSDRFVNHILEGDCTALLPTLPDGSVDTVITSPPYFHLRTYNNRSELGREDDLTGYVASLLTVFRECVRVIKPTGVIVFNLGDKYLNGSLQLLPYRFALDALAEPEVRLINTVAWTKPNPAPRKDPRKLMAGWEPFFLFAKSADHYFDKSAYRRDARPDGRRGKNLGQSYHKLIDESPHLTDAEKAAARKELLAAIQDVRDGTLKVFQLKLRGHHALTFGGQDGGWNRRIINDGFALIRFSGEPHKLDYIDCAVECLPGNSHPAMFPVALIEELIELTTPPDGIVLDPFHGSGTTSVAAITRGRQYVGIEIDPVYHQASLERVARCRDAKQTPQDDIIGWI